MKDTYKPIDGAYGECFITSSFDRSIPNDSILGGIWSNTFWFFIGGVFIPHQKLWRTNHNLSRQGRKLKTSFFLPNILNFTQTNSLWWDFLFLSSFKWKFPLAEEQIFSPNKHHGICYKIKIYGRYQAEKTSPWKYITILLHYYLTTKTISNFLIFQVTLKWQIFLKERPVFTSRRMASLICT